MTWVVLLLLFWEMALSGNPYEALNLHLPPSVSETDCIIDPYQYSEDFENVTLGELPPCWSDKSGTANSVSVAMPAGFTSQALRLYSGSTPQTLMAIMPKISGNTVSSVKMSVPVKTDNPRVILTIGVVTDTTNLSTFTEIDSILSQTRTGIPIRSISTLIPETGNLSHSGICRLPKPLFIWTTLRWKKIPAVP